MNNTNISTEQATAIIKTGYVMQGEIKALKGIENAQINISELSRRTGESRRSCARWWGRRDEFEKDGKVQHAHRSGRPKHEAFANEQKLEEVYDMIESAPMGVHQTDIADDLGCHVKTLYNHTHNEITWRIPCDDDVVRNLDELAEKRVEFAEAGLTPRGKLKKKFATGSHLDHKWFKKYGDNRTHNMQGRRKGSLVPVQGIPKAQNTPKVHCMGVANSKGTDIFRHAKIVQYARKDGRRLENIPVDGEEHCRGVRAMATPFMQKTGSTCIFMDCVRVNHCQQVVETFENAFIEVWPSAGYPHNVKGGFPPTSHVLSIMDGWLYSPGQDQFSKHFKGYMKSLRDSGETIVDSEEVYLYKEVLKFWRQKPMQMKAAEAFEQYEDRLHAVLRTNGYMDQKKR